MGRPELKPKYDLSKVIRNPPPPFETKIDAFWKLVGVMRNEVERCVIMRRRQEEREKDHQVGSCVSKERIVSMLREWGWLRMRLLSMLRAP